MPGPADTVTLQVASLFTRATGHGDGARNEALSAARQIQKFTREQPECGSQARRHGVQRELGRRWTRAAALAPSQSVSHSDRDGAGGSELSGPLGMGTGPDTKHKVPGVFKFTR